MNQIWLIKEKISLGQIKTLAKELVQIGLLPCSDSKEPACNEE